MTFVWRLIWIEMRRKFQQARAYIVDVLADQVLFTLGFLFLSGLFQLIADTGYSASDKLTLLVGFVVWRVADGCMLNTTKSLTDDAQWGTLEQLWLSPVNPSLILASRALAVFVYHCCRALLIVFVAVLLLGLLPIVRSGILCIFFMTQIAAFGVAFMIGGLHLVHKNVSSVTIALSTALVFLTGALAPLPSDTWLYFIARLLPLTIGIDLLRQMVVEGVVLSSILVQPDFYWLLANPGFYGLVGVNVFHWGQQAARQCGSLSHY